MTIKQVGHLRNISLPLSREERKHLILTGFNGSGKSRVLEALACCLKDGNETDSVLVELSKQPETEDFIKAYYPPDRALGEDFIEYLQLKAGSENWFCRFEEILKDIFDDASLQLLFDPSAHQFLIQTANRDPVGLNFLSAGYSGILAIVCDLIRRMDTISLDLPGIVLIDEPEVHLHPEMQKRIFPLLTRTFPKIQFVVSTHSPFVLNCLDNVVIFDCERHFTVPHGLTDVPYSGIVEGYFKADLLSEIMRKKYTRYQEITDTEELEDLTDADFREMADLEMYLNNVPDFLALSVTTEYKRLKAEFRNRMNN